MENQISETEWEKAFIIIHKTAIAIKHQERNYKILMRWYWSPVALNKLNMENLEACWRCLSEKGTMEHIWYGCHVVREF